MTDTRRDAVQLPSTIWRSIALPLACIQLSCLLAAAADAPPSDAELTRIRALRKDALARPRRIWFNHDGCDASSFRESLLEGRKATPTDLLNVRTTPLAAAQVDTLSYCSISSGFSNFTHRTKVGHTFTGASSTKGRKNITQDLIDQGTDPLQVMVDFCHANDMECFWSMRMNDTHDAGWRPGAGHRLFPQLKKDHPEYLVGSYENKPPYGTWTSVNYARPEIRELCYRYIEEVCQNYDVDGVEMDFFRHLCYFKSVAHGGRATQAELDMMTEMVRRIRSMTEREGIRRGKPILVAIRVPDSVDYAKGVGLDFERWMEEGWIDCLIATGYFRLNPWSKLVELGHACGVRVYPCLSETRIRQDKDGLRARRSDACYRARAMNVWHAGADGVYIFNEYNAGRGYLNDIGAVATLQGKPKAYFASVRNGSPSRYLTGGNTYSRLRLLSPADPIPLVVGRRTQVELVIGEDFSSGARAAAQPEVVCRIDIDGVFPNGNR
ncbi:MAG: family 10 glycosylhydrolase, partial [Lentisphaerae bacterium]|nr:family 10 glycosylhydrolase [Lentisphaerota bacterium]